MPDPAASRLRNALIAATLAVGLAGCTAADIFSGRLILINATGGTLRSPVISYSHTEPSPQQRLEFPDMAPGESQILESRGDRTLVVTGSLKLTFTDEAGVARTRIIPFGGEVPDYSHDDFVIEVSQVDRVRWDLIPRYTRERLQAIFLSYALTGGVGLWLGWILRGHRARREPSRPPHLGKFLVDLDLA